MSPSMSGANKDFDYLCNFYSFMMIIIGGGRIRTHVPFSTLLFYQILKQFILSLLLLYPIQYKLGKTLVILTFSLHYWFRAGGDALMSAEEAKEEAMRHIENAIQIFKEVSKVYSFFV